LKATIFLCSIFILLLLCEILFLLAETAAYTVLSLAMRSYIILICLACIAVYKTTLGAVGAWDLTMVFGLALIRFCMAWAFSAYAALTWAFMA